MRIQLYNDKQVMKIVESVKRQFLINFDKAEKELNALLDAEIKKQIETNVKIKEYIEERKTELDVVLKLTNLNEQVKEISEDYYIYGDWRLPDVEGFNQELFDKYTQNTIKRQATSAANRALGLDDIHYRKDCLLDDIIARVAVMSVVDYDNIITLLNNKINIKDYFVTL